MNKYILFIIILFLFIYFKDKRWDESRKITMFIIWSSIFLALESGLRSIAVGSDTYQFYRIFESVKTYSYQDLFLSLTRPEDYYIKDPFYWLFQKGFQQIFPYFRYLLMFVAVFFFYALGRFLKNNLDSMVKIFTAYVFYLGMFHDFFSITATRQTIALSLTILAYEMLTKKRFVPAAAFTLLASGFHTSAIIFFAAFFIPYIKKLGKFTFFATLLVAAFCYIFRSYVSTYFVSAFGFNDRFDMYMEAKDASFSIAIAVLYFSVLAGVIIFRKSFSTKETLSRNVVLYMMTVCLLPTMYIAATAVRITFYFSISMYVLVPEIVSRLKIPGKYTVITMLMMLLMWFSVRRADPYFFYWERAQVPEEYGTVFVEEGLFDFM